MDLFKLKKQLSLHEGVRLQKYLDSRGYWTIGVGHNLNAKPLNFDISNGITMDQAMSILDTDLMVTIAFLTKNCPWWLTFDDVRQRAITDLTFNIMGKLLDFHHMIDAITKQDWHRAHDELMNSDFAHEVGQRAVDLSLQLLTGHD